MATFPIRVVIDPSGAVKGAGRVRSELSNVDKAAKSMGDSIKRALATLGASLGIREVVKLADSFTLLQNQLRTVTKGAKELAEVTEDVRKVANNTRTAVDVTAVAYARFSRALAGTGATQKEILQLTESVNQAIRLSGSTAAESRNGLIQFSQGLAFGALRGDEFRSVTEQISEVAKVVENQLGITRGELTRMAHAGELTADVIFKAFKAARVEIADRFAREALPTVGDQLEVLRNEFIFFLKSLKPVFDGLGTAIRFVADNMFIVATIVGTALVPAMLRLIATTLKWIALKFGEVLLLGFAEAFRLAGAVTRLGAAISGLISSSAGLRAVAILFGALGIAGAIAAAGVALALFIANLDKIRAGAADRFEKIANDGSTLASDMKRSAQEVSNAGGSMTGSFLAQSSVLISEVEKLVGITGKWREATLRQAKALKETASAAMGLTFAMEGMAAGMQVVATAQDRWDARPLSTRMRDLVNLLKGALPVAIDDYVDKLEAAREAWQQFLEDVQRTQDRLDPATAAHREFQRELDLLFKAYESGVIPTTERYIELVGLLTKEYNDNADKLRELSGEVTDFDKLMKQAIDGSKDFEDSDFLGNAIPGEDMLNAFDDLIENMEDALALQRLSAQERQRELAIRRAIQDLEDKQGEPARAEQISSIEQQVDEYFNLLDIQKKRQEEERAALELAQEFSRTIVDAAFEGDQSFSELFGNLFKNLAKAIAQALILKGILAATGTPAPPGSLGPIGSLLGFAQGGAFTVGGAGGTDSQIVAFRATPGEHVEVRTPQQVSQGIGGGSAPNVNVVVVANEEEAFRALMSQRDAGESIMVHLGRRRGDLRRILAGG